MKSPKETLILTIDDEKAIRDLFKKFLSEKGYTVIEANNGRTGIEIFKQRKPDLVLVDLLMPEVNGYDVLAYLQKKSPQTPVIVVSSSNIINNVIEAIHMGAWDYILKPIYSVQIFLHTIEKNLEKASLLEKRKEYQMQLEEAYQSITQDLKMACTIQQKLFPKRKLTINEFTFEHYLIPSLYLSGDFVDYFQINENLIAFYMVDVSGHGVPSALITILLKSFMRKYRDEYNTKLNIVITQPNKIVKLLNKELIEENLDKFLTIVFGVIDCEKNTLTITNGGHYPYPLLCNKEYSKTINTDDPPVGLYDKQDYRFVKIDLPDRFYLSVFSDGIMEILPHKTASEKVAFLKLLTNSNEKNFNTFFSHIEKVKSKLPDDITVLSIKRGHNNG